MPRPKRQGARRASIIEAAGRAVRDRGLAEVRVRDIAEQAGLSPGSVLYYYPEIGELMVEVHNAAVSEFYDGRTAEVDAAGQRPADRLVAAVRSGLPSGPEDEVCRLLYEMHSLADRSTPHAALMSSLFDREVALYRGALELGSGLGEFAPRRPIDEVARNVVTLEDGYGLHIVSRNRSVQVETATRHILGYLASMTGCAALIDEYERSTAG